MTSISYGAVAIGSFRAQHNGELSFTKGTEMLVSSEPTDGWLTAIVGAERGLVPVSYIRRRELQPAFMCHDFQGAGSTELTAFEGERLGLVQTGVRLEGWSVVVRTADGAGPGRDPGPGLVPSSWLVLAPAVLALGAFRAEHVCELSVEEGEVLWALGKAGGGGLEVLNSRGQVGTVPEALVDLIPDSRPDAAAEVAYQLADIDPERSAQGRLTLSHGPAVRAPGARHRTSSTSTASSDWTIGAAGTARSLGSSGTLVLGEVSGRPIGTTPRRRLKGKPYEAKAAPWDATGGKLASSGSSRYAGPEEGMRVGSRSRGWAVRRLVRLLPLHRQSARVHVW
jgi:hypothetical protein